MNIVLQGFVRPSMIGVEAGAITVQLDPRTRRAVISDNIIVIGYGDSPDSSFGWKSFMLRTQNSSTQLAVETLGPVVGAIHEASMGRYVSRGGSRDFRKTPVDFIIFHEASGYTVDATVRGNARKTASFAASFIEAQLPDAVLQTKKDRTVMIGMPGRWRTGSRDVQVFPENYKVSDEPTMEFLDKFLSMLLEQMSPPPSAQAAAFLTRR